MNKKSIVIPWISLGFLLLGMLYSFCYAFRCSISTQRHILLCVLIAGVASFFGIKLRKKYMLLAYLIVLLGTILIAVFRMEQLREDFLSFVYYINAKSMDYNQTSWIGFEGVRGKMDNNMLLSILGLWIALYIAYFAFRHSRCLFGFLPVYAVPALGLCVGIAPDKKALLFWIIGVLFSLSWISCQKRGGRNSFVQRERADRRKVFSYIVLFLLLGAGFLGAQILEVNTSSKILSHSKEYLKRQHKMEREFANTMENIGQRLAARFGIDSDGRLSNTAPVYMKDTVIKLTLLEKPTNSFYLKGFVGGDYHNGRWYPCETERLREIVADQRGEKDIWQAGYVLVECFGRGLGRLAEKKYETPIQLKMEYVGKGKRSKYAYIPYFSDLNSIADENGNDCVSVNGENGLERKSNSYYVNCYNVGREIPEMTEMMQGGNYLLMSRKQLNGYHNYIKELYGSLPAEELSQLKSLARTYYIDGENEVAMAQRIRQLLRQSAQYSQELEPIPEGMDYVEFFLFSQRKGYCEHFATAGTLLARAKGIPARFVSGYKVPAKRFIKNEDGTYTANVLDSDAHAWTEIFIGNASGWYPIEMTPEAGAIRRQNVTANVVQPDHEKKVTKPPEATKPHQTKKPKASPGASSKTKDVKKQKNTGSVDKRLKKEGYFADINTLLRFGMGIIIVTILFIIMLRRILYPRMQRKRYDKLLGSVSGDYNAFIQVSIMKFLFFLKHCGIRLSGSSDEDRWIKETASICGNEFEQETWERIKVIVQEAQYAGENVTQEDFRLFCDTIEKAGKILYAKQRRGRRRHLWLVFKEKYGMI